jgi:hypothetical protein
MYAILADLVLTTHVIVFLFVVGGLILILIGNLFSWYWVNSITFRLLHLCAILVVVAESWFGITCPLTTLENSLRVRAGSSGIGPSFVEYWFQRILFYEAPSWVFALAYTLFATAVVWAWLKYPPSKSRRANSDA